YRHTSENIAMLVAQQDFTSATRILHGLVSASGNLGASQLCYWSQELETALTHTPETAHGRLNELRRSLKAALAEANEILVRRASSLSPREKSLSPESGRLETLVHAMITLLERHDTSAFDQLDALVEALRSSVPQTELSRFEERIRAYDF